MNNQPIGIMDSGLGGFSTALELQRLLPRESILYYGDTLYMPYGNKTKEFLKERVSSICFSLQTLGCKAIVIACSTASFILTQYPEAFSLITIPIFNIIPSTISLIKNQPAPLPYITVLATELTIKSEIYQQMIAATLPQTHITAIATVEWAFLVENFSLDSTEIKEGIKKYLPLLPNDASHTILLACTHYAFLEPLLREYLPLSPIINTSTPIVKEIKEALTLNNQLASLLTPVHRVFSSSPASLLYQQIAKNILGIDIKIETYKESL